MVLWVLKRLIVHGPQYRILALWLMHHPRGLERLAIMYLKSNIFPLFGVPQIQAQNLPVVGNPHHFPRLNEALSSSRIHMSLGSK
jgi:hypothetical protein